ncbi:putative aldehyde dehydrogenase-like protein [Colletotrichum siamense]|uniref:Aldehyde dehydrogenase-like protein n=1 Tax=Colletotrichum siamense TaxID=690259 RepID=A0A9P5BTT3_COLSI|nr:putative aldehyde dehydrogenase-like protein [Colletotrichum siamense]KAF4844286.1 putative aldehyde dehydrogenase-like protein [Colletotrichum siamense]
MAFLVKKLTAPNGRVIELNTGLFINNEFTPGTASPITTINPADETEITTVQAASAEDVDHAVRAARDALLRWRQNNPVERGELLHDLAQLMRHEKEILATLEAWDNGKPYQTALAEDLEEAISVIKYYAGWADKIHGQTMSNVGPDGYKFGFTVREPIGVCAQIIPWNYPLSMAAWKIGPAIACGNTVILKPAEQTPLSILYLARLIQRAGFPPGVINIVNGTGREAGATLASHMDVDKVAFTGSTNTARQIMKLAGSNLKSITLETGGKSPLIIFEDADLEQASRWAQIGIMSNQGQICTATSRLLVHRSVAKAFVAKFQEVIAEANILGDPFAETTSQGPQISKEHYERILGFIERAPKEGAVLSLGGRPFRRCETNNGFFIEPTIFTEVSPHSELFQEEIFGPVAAVTLFDTEEEAITLANDSKYGLGAAIFTTNIQRAHRVFPKLESGQVWINSSQDGDSRLPFGGVKQSGIGRELGEAGLDAYSQIKAVHINVKMQL